ncbi:MAG: PDZ domain-containing protein, partial [Candidatus Krumholzibacteria bacterium]|nr:PDZ domain-containing protein [Candidatus Krumholzibacteria bacterium]
PAEKAGLQGLDVDLSVDGKAVDTVDQLRNTVSLMPVGHETKLVDWRGGKTINVKVKLDTLPDQDQLASRRSVPTAEDGLDGVTVRELTERVRSQARIPDDVKGLLVVEVDQRSRAAREGLARGDVIMEVNRSEVTSLRDYSDAVKRDTDKPVLLRVYRPQTQARIYVAIPR